MVFHFFFFKKAILFFHFFQKKVFIFFKKELFPLFSKKSSQDRSPACEGHSYSAKISPAVVPKDHLSHSAATPPIISIIVGFC